MPTAGRARRPPAAGTGPDVLYPCSRERKEREFDADVDAGQPAVRSRCSTGGSTKCAVPLKTRASAARPGVSTARIASAGGRTDEGAQKEGRPAELIVRVLTDTALKRRRKTRPPRGDPRASAAVVIGSARDVCSADRDGEGGRDGTNRKRRSNLRAGVSGRPRGGTRTQRQRRRQ